MSDSKSQALLEVFPPDDPRSHASGCSVSISQARKDIQMAQPVSTRRTAIVDRFFNELERQFGLPTQIVHDNSQEFVSESNLKALVENVYQKHSEFPLASPPQENEAGDGA